ncbi:ATP synthase subunit e, mitochondrial-like [Bos javanicus]|uniref:ATP synthase subunit e, mitochondrial-like n=1 Tax=Bos taurus TaxID=9913 RepID=UPI0000EBD91F|nr:ATP synthase subunit e, mitochondrial-like [Bos taurus]XP_061295870.1 ATP synthase subunit e, mitochondrial-like [Bos javanicus]
MVSPVQVSPLIKLVSYSALFLSVAYGARRYNYPKPWAEEERRIAEKKKQDEQKCME